jgi:hypothetical protein
MQVFKSEEGRRRPRSCSERGAAGFGGWRISGWFERGVVAMSPLDSVIGNRATAIH